MDLEQAVIICSESTSAEVYQAKCEPFFLQANIATYKSENFLCLGGLGTSR